MPTMISTLDLSRGTVIELDKGLYTVLEYQVVKAGKGNSEVRVRAKLRDVRSGSTIERMFRGDDKVARASMEHRPAQFLYNDGDLYHFMDGESYEEKLLTAATLGDAARYLTDGMAVELLTYNDQPISLQLPTTVDLRIKDTEPGFKGDTAQAGSKKATTETGLLVEVPLFVNQGETIRVDTRTNTYVSRVG